LKGISTAIRGRTASLDATSIRNEVHRFAQALRSHGVEAVRVWCSYNPDLPDDSPLQSPEEQVAPASIVPFFDQAVQNGVWSYGDIWNRAGIDSLDGSFSFFLGNDKDIRLGSSDALLLDEVRSAWTTAGYKVVEWERERVA
jgi:hypothetical protein